MSETAPAPRIPKPAWLRVRAPTSLAFAETRRLMRAKGLTTVCEEAACPNIGECWSQKHATVMILGDTCTRACAFCNVKTGMPQPVDLLEPEHLAEAAAEMGLEHIVVTSVDRDDLADELRGFALLGIASPWGWTGLFGPALMLYFLTRVTGIAATEAHALQSRGEAYAKYQREVSAFVPWPPKG